MLVYNGFSVAYSDLRNGQRGICFNVNGDGVLTACSTTNVASADRVGIQNMSSGFYR